jgi:nitrogen fixation protein NifU and related proteins
MAALESLYDEVMLDHIRNARNYRVIADANRTVQRFNPLCGDEMTVYLKLDHDVICDIAFQCSCCGISMASASIMTESMKGKSAAAAKALIEDFNAGLREEGPRANAALEAVREFPSRRDCAALAWEALQSAFE